MSTLATTPDPAATAAVLGNGRTTFREGRSRRSPKDEAGAERGRSSRRGRFQRRAQLRKITNLPRVRRCGYCTTPETGPTLAITQNRDGSRTAGYGGLATCGSVWACPQCAATVAVRKADEIAQVMAKVGELGGSSFMWTGTIRHSARDRLGLDATDRARRGKLDLRRRTRNRLDKIAARRAERDTATVKGWDVDEGQAHADDIEEASIWKKITKTDPGFAGSDRAADTTELAALDAGIGCWDAVIAAWDAAISGAAWTEDQTKCGGLLGWVRVVEVTDGGTPAILTGCTDPECYSGNGWHVHVHALLCFADDVSEDLASSAVGAGMFARWRRKLRSVGFDASEEHGWDMRKTYMGDGTNMWDYLMKQAHEVTGAHRKEGKRRGGRTPMQLLRTAVESYRVEDLGRWWEWEAASQGRKQLGWSGGDRSLRELAGLGKEKTDEELAEEDLGEDQRLGIDPLSWWWIVAREKETELLDAAEIGGFDGARRWLRRHGLTWTEATPARTHRRSWEERLRSYVSAERDTA